MDKLCEKLQDCKVCRFANDEVNVYNEEKGFGKFGCYAMSYDADIMVVGQNPSKHRNPPPLNHSMSGHQGDLFREIFGEDRLIFTNLVKISTPNNKITIEDAHHGYNHLLDEIVFWKPKIILALGRYCREVLPVSPEIMYLQHPDYAMVYKPELLVEYRKALETIKVVYDTSYKQERRLQMDEEAGIIDTSKDAHKKKQHYGEQQPWQS